MEMRNDPPCSLYALGRPRSCTLLRVRRVGPQLSQFSTRVASSWSNLKSVAVTVHVLLLSDVSNLNIGMLLKMGIIVLAGLTAAKRDDCGVRREPPHSSRQTQSPHFPGW